MSENWIITRLGELYENLSAIEGALIFSISTLENYIELDEKEKCEELLYQARESLNGSVNIIEQVRVSLGEIAQEIEDEQNEGNIDIPDKI